MAGCYREAVRKTGCGAIEQGSDREVEKREVFPAGVAEGFNVFVSGHAANQPEVYGNLGAFGVI